MTMRLSEPLGDNRLKVGVYNDYHAQLYSTVYPDNGDIVKIDEYNYTLQINHGVTMRFFGRIEFRFCVLSNDLSMVNAGETCIETDWEKEPVNTSLTKIN